MATCETRDVDRAARARAILFVLGAAVIAATALMYTPDRLAAAQRVSWIALVLLWTFILVTGGANRMNRAARARLNNEFSRANRARAFRTGFLATIGAALLVSLFGTGLAIALELALRIVTGAGLAAALLHYAVLEW